MVPERLPGENRFQREAKARINQLLEQKGVTTVESFFFIAEVEPCWACRFVYRNVEYDVMVFDDNVTMSAPSQLFEVYERSEWRTADTRLEGFLERLDRFLAGGPW